VPAANPKYHNAKVDAGDEDVEGEELLRRFNWQVSRAGVMEEIRRRRRHEDARDKRKRKARSAARRFRRRCVLDRYILSIFANSIVAWLVVSKNVASIVGMNE
jgi:ribosomal protein S21